jgi:hypothetical protein
MNTSEIHVDVMSEIYNYQLNQMLEDCKNGVGVSFEEFIEFATNGMALSHKQYMDLADTCKDFGNTIMRMQKEISRERRIIELFLINHKLFFDYENFEARILERIFKNKEAKP